MKKVLICVLFSLWCCVAIANPLLPTGHWKTIDDVTGKPKSILDLYEENGVLYGKVEKIFPKPGHDQSALCTECKGEQHNQPIVGMVIMEGLKQNPKQPLQWGEGQILDPENGHVYRCQLTLSQDGKALTVRGYIGITLFGRSQTWLREEGSDGHPV